jgi:hypothetical protein
MVGAMAVGLVSDRLPFVIGGAVLVALLVGHRLAMRARPVPEDV